MTHLAVLKTRLWLETGQLGLARSWAQQTGLRQRDIPTYANAHEFLTYMRVLIHDGQSAQVATLLESLASEDRSAGRYNQLIEILVVQAIAEFASGRVQSATEKLQEAMELGRDEGYFMVFLREGRLIVELLRYVLAYQGTHQEFAKSLLEVMGLEIETVKTSSGEHPVILSARETEVLKLVSSGLSNRDIGSTLFISEETVKTHLRRIYEKLEVSSRTQAVDRARQLNLN